MYRTKFLILFFAVSVSVQTYSMKSIKPIGNVQFRYADVQGQHVIEYQAFSSNTLEKLKAIKKKKSIFCAAGTFATLSGAMVTTLAPIIDGLMGYIEGGPTLDMTLNTAAFTLASSAVATTNWWQRKKVKNMIKNYAPEPKFPKESLKGNPLKNSALEWFEVAHSIEPLHEKIIIKN